VLHSEFQTVAEDEVLVDQVGRWTDDCLRLASYHRHLLGVYIGDDCPLVFEQRFKRQPGGFMLDKDDVWVD